MKLIVDTREQELFKKIEFLVSNIPSFRGLEIETQQLPLGDLVIRDGDGKDILLIERKSLADLAASIKDGRYEEQSYRLDGIDHPNHNIVYLVEGDLNKFGAGGFFKERVDKLTLYSAMFSLNFFKGFSVLRSMDANETATIVCNMASKLMRSGDKVPFYAGCKCHHPSSQQAPETDESAAVGAGKEYVAVAKRVKKDNISKDNIGEIMLCQIPGISSATALAILSKFHSISELVVSLKEDSNCLNDIKTVDASGKPRKISKAVTAKLQEFLS